MSSAKHAPNRLDRYRDIHETVMRHYRDQLFVVGDDLSFRDQGGGVITIEGCITCEHGLYIAVTKALEVVEGGGHDAMVQTIFYSYNAVLGGVGNVFRYDSAHLDHNQDHHVHRYEVFAGDVAGVTTIHGEDGWPTHGEVIGELRDWAADHAEDLASYTTRT